MGQHKRRPQPRPHEYREYTILVPRQGQEYIEKYAKQYGITGSAYIKLALAERLSREEQPNE